MTRSKTVRSAVSGFACLALVAGAVTFEPPPAQANPFQQLRKDFTKGVRKIEKSLKKNSTRRNATLLGTLAGAAIGAAIIDDGVAGVVIGAAAGAFIGNQIGKDLNERQQRKVTRSTVNTVVTGQDETWVDEESKTSGTVRVLSTEQRHEVVSVPVHKEKVAEVPPLDFIGEAYEVSSTANLRGGPDISYEKVGSIKRGSKVNVVGKVKDAPWYFVSENGVGSGFLFAELAKPSTASVVAKAPPVVQSEDIYVATVSDQTLCRTIEQTVTAADGTTKTETMTACKGANGWEVQSS